jgi:hypothetical protein
MIIERLPDWSYGAFLNETDASCIAIGMTEEEARENGERELKRMASSSSGKDTSFSAMRRGFDSH